MLILKRRIGEQLIIREDIVVTILGVRANQISVGVSAPTDVGVRRAEVRRRRLRPVQR